MSFQSLESYRIRLYKWDKFLASIIPLLVLTYFAYIVDYDKYVLILGGSAIALITLSVQGLTAMNFSTSKLIHFIGAFGVITISSLTLPFIQYEYFLMPLTMLTVYSTYPFQKELWSNVIGSLCIIASIVLYINEVFTYQPQPEYVLFNQVFSFVLLYIATIEIVMTALIGRKYKEIIDRDRTILQDQKDELEKYIESNLQLENFAHIASHDLKTPLSNIIKFAQLLQFKTKAKLNEEEKDLFKFIISGSKHMSETINSLFQFSQATNKKVDFSRFSINGLCDELLDDISVLIQETKAEINISRVDQQIRGDRVLMKQLFLNLILNGIKFVKEGTTPKIDIDFQHKEDYWKVSIKDNGIGIDANYLDSIFVIFKRLHPADKYEGSGAGLAICKKIVEHHGGKIWVNSKINEGSTFHFTINT